VVVSAGLPRKALASGQDGGAVPRGARRGCTAARWGWRGVVEGEQAGAVLVAELEAVRRPGAGAYYLPAAGQGQEPVPVTAPLPVFSRSTFPSASQLPLTTVTGVPSAVR